MSADWLAQAERLTEFQRAVRERFQEGGSILGVLFAVLLIAAVLVGAAWWSRRLERKPRPGADLSPNDLFETVMAQLKLNPSARKRLREAARAAHLKNPTVLVLSPRAFDTHVAMPTAKGHDRAAATGVSSTPSERSADSHVAQLRAFLFPDSVAVSSPAIQVSSGV